MTVLDMWRWLLLLFLAMLSAPAGAADLTVVVGPEVPVSRASQDTLRAVFALRMTNWPNGQPVTVVMLPADDPLTRRFVTEMLDMLPYQLQRQWDRRVYAGLGSGPVVEPTPAAVAARVARTPGAIAFLPAAYNNKGGVHALVVVP